MSEPTPSSVPASSERLKALEAEWQRRFLLQPKLPSSALLSGALAMACGFGAVMFFMFALATGFRSYGIQLAIFAGLSLALGLLNRLAARRWYREVQQWSAEREAMSREIERLRGNG